MGNPDGPRSLSQDLYWRILRKQLTLTGTWNSSYGHAASDWMETLQALADQALRTDMAVTHILEKAELAKGLAMMRNRSEFYCKVVVRWSI